MSRLITILALAASCIAAAAPAQGTMLLRHLSLEAVTAEAGHIVHGTVVDVRSGRDERGIPATWITLDVARTVKGRRASQLTVKQFGAIEPLGDGAIGGVPGLPRYRAGEDVVLFLRSESAHGFTSPVGFDDGVYRVRTDAARSVVGGPGGGSAPSEDVDAFLDRVEAMVRGTK